MDAGSIHIPGFSVIESFLYLGLLFLISYYLARTFGPYPAKFIEEKNLQPQHKKPALSTIEIEAIFENLPRARTIEIIDGDSVVIRMRGQNIEIRLDSIDAPEGNQPWGDYAKYGLIKMIGGKSVIVEEHGSDPYGRILATLYVTDSVSQKWTNVNERMVMLGHAWVMRVFFDHLPSDRQEKLCRLEQWAKTKKMGLWSHANPIPPWQWRKINRLQR